MEPPLDAWITQQIEELDSDLEHHYIAAHRHLRLDLLDDFARRIVARVRQEEFAALRAQIVELPHTYGAQRISKSDVLALIDTRLGGPDTRPSEEQLTTLRTEIEREHQQWANATTDPGLNTWARERARTRVEVLALVLTLIDHLQHPVEADARPGRLSI